MSAKFTVAELARMMGKPPKEVLFLLQGIGVDVKSAESVLDPGTAQAILTGKTQAPKTLIVRQTPLPQPPAAGVVGTPKPKAERAALKRIKIVDKGPEAEGATSDADVPAVEAAAGSTPQVAPTEPETVSVAPTADKPVPVAPAPEPAPPAKVALVTEPAPAVAPEPPPVKAPSRASRAAAKVAAPAPEPVPEAAIAASAPPAPLATPEPVEPVEPAVPSAAAPVPSLEEPPRQAPPPAAETEKAPVTEAPKVAAAATHPPAAVHPPRHPAPAKPPVPRPTATAPATGAVRRSASGIQTASPASLRAAAQKPAVPGARPGGPAGALGRIMKRTGEPSVPLSAATAASMPLQPSNPASAPSSSHHAPQAMRSAPPVSSAAAPRSGVSGRAVIAPPSAATIRAVARPTPGAVVARPAIPAPATPGTFQRPGMPPRPGFAPRPGFPARPGMLGRGGPMAPAMPPPAIPGTTDRSRRKDAVKGGSAVPAKKDDKKTASKKLRTKEASALATNVRDYLGTFREDTYEDVPGAVPGEGEEVDPNRPISKSAQRRAGKRTMMTETGAVIEVKKDQSGPVFLSEGVTVKELSEKTGILAKDLVKAFLGRGILAAINHPVNPVLAVEIARDFGIEAAVVSFEEDLELSRQQSQADDEAANAASTADKKPRAPVVTVMGHVDHGKTSLLDAIRKAKVAEGEAGGITQHIGAYRVQVKGRAIVFLDTPGHEAFTMMRARGARATDIVVLVVAADDGVMPQTAEAIDHARAAKVPVVVAINKIDKPEANVMRVKQALADKGVLVEEYGGEVVSCEISAKKLIGIDALLEMILLQADLLELKAAVDGPARGVVLEARREVGRGTLATVLVQHGTLKVGDVFFAGSAVGRVRAMLDDRGQRVLEAGPATPVEVMGFDDIPNSGDSLQVVEDESKARQVTGFRQQKEREEALAKTSRLSLDSLFTRMAKGEVKELPIILKADVHGSEEVITQSLNKLSTAKVKVNVLHTGVGAISVNDVLLASASEAIVIGFNVRPERKAQELADKEGVDIRLYSVIYNLTDEIKKAMAGLLDTVSKEIAKGRAEVRETFRIPKIGFICGCMVVDGVIPRGANARLLRDNRVIYEGKIGSLRRFKEDASEVKSGFECGIGIAGYQDVKVGDVIEAFVTEEVAASLT
ncbi:MAG: translation initiation factor IF-2 [Holophagales bacterium]|nr:translation initiation factor IF-2 [Holophagales bacterium]